MSYTHNKKYIVIAGCSYAHKSLKTIHELLDSPNDEEMEFIHVNTSASNNEYICESILLTCNSLLNEKVNPSNILVINNYTQIGRFNPVVPKELESEIEKTLTKTEYRSLKSFSYEFFNTFVKVNKRLYSLMLGSYGLPNRSKKWIEEHEKYFTTLKRPLSYFEDYLKSIIFVQKYLKEKKIEQISFMMSNVFEGWDNDLSHIYTKSKEWKLPSTKDTKHISELSEILKIYWDIVDLDKITFYKTEENKYGGIDEYFINEFTDKKYLQDVDSRGYWFANHPIEEVYEKFTDELLKPKLLKWKAQHIL